MNPIYLLVEYRLNNFMIDFDFKERNGFTYISRCKEMKQKLISYGYITDNLNYCFAAIKHMIWKNIINYEIVENKMRVHMYYNNYISEYPIKIYYIYHDSLLNINDDGRSLDNMDIMHDIIINFFLLVDNVVMSNLIPDILSIMKLYVFDVMLMV